MPGGLGFGEVEPTVFETHTSLLAFLASFFLFKTSPSSVWRASSDELRSIARILS